jgi:hypothetical protein
MAVPDYTAGVNATVPTIRSIFIVPGFYWSSIGRILALVAGNRKGTAALPIQGPILDLVSELRKQYFANRTCSNYDDCGRSCL